MHWLRGLQRCLASSAIQVPLKRAQQHKSHMLCSSCRASTIRLTALSMYNALAVRSETPSSFDLGCAPRPMHAPRCGCGCGAVVDHPWTPCAACSIGAVHTLEIGQSGILALHANFKSFRVYLFPQTSTHFSLNFPAKRGHAVCQGCAAPREQLKCNSNTRSIALGGLHTAVRRSFVTAAGVVRGLC